MTTRTPRLLLAFSALLLAAGAAFHAAAFKRAVAAIGASNLSPFFAGSFKLLWLADSTTMLIFAAIFAFIAIRPSATTRPIVLLLALVHVVTAVLVYAFLGSFFAGHILLVAAAAAFVAGLQLPGTKRSGAIA